MTFSTAGPSERIADLLEILELVRRKDPNSLKDVRDARNEAIKSIAAQKNISEESVRDRCWRQLGLDMLEDFDQLVFDWLTVNSLELQELLTARASAKSRAHDLSEISSFFEGPSATERRWWWVNQGRTFVHERRGGYIWAPQKGKDGKEIFHHMNVSRVKSGDVILHYVDGNIVAVSIAEGDAVEAVKPPELPADLWERNGFKVAVSYFDLKPPVSRDSISLPLRTAVGAEGKGPFTKSGNVNQGYLFALPQQFVADLTTQFPQLNPPGIAENELPNGLDRFIGMIKNLRVDRENGIPKLYKPAILWTIVNGLDSKGVNFNEFDFDWIARHFRSVLAEYGQVVDDRQAAAAFFHLQNEPFWELILKDPTNPPLRGEPAQLRNTVRFAKFREPYWTILNNWNDRQKIRKVLWEHWFKNFSLERGDELFELKAAVSKVIVAIEQRGFSFEPWQIACYITALRTKPFLILAGVSGSGKSQLPQLIATATGGISELIPVRSDWTDSSDVLGYVQLHGQLRPGPLLCLADEAIRAPSKFYSCVIDEMNLARVEHYFAEVLSRIEQARANGGTSSGRLLTQSLSPEDKKWESVYLPTNLALIGTVNMDESTHGFSRKVLDRAFTLEFSEIDLTNWEHGASVEISSEVWPVSAWKARATQLAALGDVTEQERLQIQKVISVLVDLNKFLNHAQLQLAYRSRDEIVLFVLHANDVLDSFVSRTGMEVDPLDVAIQMKVLPRIAGGSGPIRRLVLSLLGWSWTGKEFVDENDTLSLISDWADQEKPHFLSGARFPRTCARLCLMWERIKNEGFTSFWL